MTPFLSRSLLAAAAVVLAVAAADARTGSGLRAVLGAGAVVLVAAALLVRAAPAAAPVDDPSVTAAAERAVERVLGWEVGPPTARSDDEESTRRPRHGRAAGSLDEGGCAHEPTDGRCDASRTGAVRSVPGAPTAAGAVPGAPAADPAGRPVEIEVGRDPAGRPVVVSAAAGIAVVGTGALAEAVHRALVERLAGQASSGDELRCIGAVPPGVGGSAHARVRTVLRRARADGSLRVGPADAAAGAGCGDVDSDGIDGDGIDDDGIDDDGIHDDGVDARSVVDVATLIGPGGDLRGAVVRSRDLDRPIAPGTMIEVGRTGCRIRSGGGVQPLDPALPLLTPETTPRDGRARCGRVEGEREPCEREPCEREPCERDSHGRGSRERHSRGLD